MSVELLDFYADWCGPCKVMEPVLEEARKSLAGKAEIKEIDVDAEGETAERYGVMSIPTYILLKDGQEVERMVGAQPKDEFLEKINSHLS